MVRWKNKRKDEEVRRKKSREEKQKEKEDKKEKKIQEKLTVMRFIIYVWLYASS